MTATRLMYECDGCENRVEAPEVEVTVAAGTTGPVRVVGRVVCGNCGHAMRCIDPEQRALESWRARGQGVPT